MKVHLHALHHTITSSSIFRVECEYLFANSGSCTVGYPTGIMVNSKALNATKNNEIIEQWDYWRNNKPPLL